MWLARPAAAQQGAEFAQRLAPDTRLLIAAGERVPSFAVTGAAWAPTVAPGATGGRRRVRGALAGFLVGAATGIAIGHALRDEDCACEDPGLTEAVLGYAIGGTIGAGFGAAIPASTVPSCEFRNRVGPGIVGGVAGGAIGVGSSALLGAVTGGIGFATAPLTVVVGSVYGSSRLLQRC